MKKKVTLLLFTTLYLFSSFGFAHDKDVPIVRCSVEITENDTTIVDEPVHKNIEVKSNIQTKTP